MLSGSDKQVLLPCWGRAGGGVFRAKDGFNVYDEIKKGLIEKGVPSSEVSFIHDAKKATF